MWSSGSGMKLRPSLTTATTSIASSGKSDVSCRSGVLSTGQSGWQRTPTSLTRSRTSGIMSKAPGTRMRRATERATSISGEITTSMATLALEKRSA